MTDTATKRKLVAYYSASFIRLDAQRELVWNYANEAQCEIIAEFNDIDHNKKGVSPELKRAVFACEKHRAKLIIATLACLPKDTRSLTRIFFSGVGWISVRESRTDSEMLMEFAEFWR